MPGYSLSGGDIGKKEMNILVTGIGGDIGIGIGRILKNLDYVDNLLGCDVHDEHAGNSIFDRCEIVPKASQPEYVESLYKLAAKRRIDAIVVTSEPELRFLSTLNENYFIPETPFVMANKASMEIGFDKLKTSTLISQMQLPNPWTKLVENEAPLNFPCILKSRYGAGNQNVYVVKSAEEACAYRNLFPNYIWQEYLPGDNTEYTCGVYGSNDGTFRTIIFRRRLVSGCTSFAELVENSEIESICKKIAQKLELKGSINIQLRLDSRGPMVFEINPRFSSTVVMRHKLGFRDVEWSLQEQILGRGTKYNLLYPVGTRLCKIYDEWIYNT
jgi:carbamoyl-phosphate synthase large subunit